MRTEKPFCAYLQIVAHFVASAVTSRGTIMYEFLTETNESTDDVIY